MAFTFNGNSPTAINFNGQPVTTLQFNGVTVWASTMNAISDLSGTWSTVSSSGVIDYNVTTGSYVYIGVGGMNAPGYYGKLRVRSGSFDISAFKTLTMEFDLSRPIVNDGGSYAACGDYSYNIVHSGGTFNMSFTAPGGDTTGNVATFDISQCTGTAYFDFTVETAYWGAYHATRMKITKLQFT